MAEIHYDGRVWEVPVLQFEGYGGKADLKGKWSFKDKEPEYRLEGEFRGVDLGLFLNRQDTAKKSSTEAQSQGLHRGNRLGSEAWHKSLKGQGEWTLTSGKFLTFDLKEALSTIEPFQNLRNVTSNLKDFDSMNFQWKISEGKAATDNMLVKSKDYITSAREHSVLTDLRISAQMYFLHRACGKIIAGNGQTIQEESPGPSGPIPILLSGSLLAPEVNPTRLKLGH